MPQQSNLGHPPEGLTLKKQKQKQKSTTTACVEKELRQEGFTRYNNVMLVEMSIGSTTLETCLVKSTKNYMNTRTRCQ